MRKTVLITGGTGLIGTALSERLIELGFQVRLLSREEGSVGQIKKYYWNYQKGEIDESCIDGVDTIVHLAGAGVADKRWTPTRKRVIIESRTETTTLLYRLLSTKNHNVKNFVSASAIGYYGTSDKKVFDENSPVGRDFLASVTKEWEKSVDTISQLGINVSKVRIGLVLSDKGGALKQLLLPVKFYVGAPLGSGGQMMSWIHIEDLVSLFEKLIVTGKKGVFNGVAPNPVSNQEMTKCIAKTVSRPLFLPNIPSVALKILLGEMGGIVLQGSTVEPTNTLKLGMTYKYPTVDIALRNLLK